MTLGHNIYIVPGLRKHKNIVGAYVLLTNNKRAIYVEMLTEVEQLTRNPMALFKMNKSVYIANHTYRFC